MKKVEISRELFNSQSSITYTFIHKIIEEIDSWERVY